jgi:TPR repeat protein
VYTAATIHTNYKTTLNQLRTCRLASESTTAAVSVLQQAVNSNSDLQPQAAAALGCAYIYGTTVRANKQQGLALLQLAAKQGEPAAFSCLAKALQAQGDYDLANSVLQRAARFGVSDAPLTYVTRHTLV